MAAGWIFGRLATGTSGAATGCWVAPDGGDAGFSEVPQAEVSAMQANSDSAKPDLERMGSFYRAGCRRTPRVRAIRSRS
jgi:hypothetical protein